MFYKEKNKGRDCFFQLARCGEQACSLFLPPSFSTSSLALVSFFSLFTMPPPEELVPFLALAKGARGRAAADVVVRAIEALDVHVFGELLDVPSVKEVRMARETMDDR